MTSWHWGIVIYNQIVTWTGFAILAMFQWKSEGPSQPLNWDVLWKTRQNEDVLVLGVLLFGPFFPLQFEAAKAATVAFAVADALMSGEPSTWNHRWMATMMMIAKMKFMTQWRCWWQQWQWCWWWCLKRAINRKLNFVEDDSWNFVPKKITSTVS